VTVGGALTAAGVPAVADGEPVGAVTRECDVLGAGEAVGVKPPLAGVRLDEELVVDR
jgi:hypothetical protein